MVDPDGTVTLISNPVLLRLKALERPGASPTGTVDEVYTAPVISPSFVPADRSTTFVPPFSSIG